MFFFSLVGFLLDGNLNFVFVEGNFPSVDGLSDLIRCVQKLFRVVGNASFALDVLNGFSMRFYILRF